MHGLVRCFSRQSAVQMVSLPWLWVVHGRSAFQSATTVGAASAAIATIATLPAAATVTTTRVPSWRVACRILCQIDAL